MARKVVWSPEAVDDLTSIAGYIERDSPWYATIVARRLVELAEESAVFPNAGRIVPEKANPAVRERFAYRFRLLYHVHDDRIVILTIVHGSRSLVDVLSDPER
ncbi:MAG TPA: type II toxin-antitoxin system RelE/ParE family toxin [Rudaea sp.]